MGMKGSTPAASTIIFVFILDTIKKCSCKLYDDGGMLTVYRHNPVLCKSTDRCYKRCTCPTWVEGMVGDKYVRHSLKTRSWEREPLPKCARWMLREIQIQRRPRRTNLSLLKGRSTNIWQTPRRANWERPPSTNSTSSFASSFWRGPKREATNSFVNSICGRSRHTAPRGRWSARQEEKARTPYRLLLVLHSCWMGHSEPYEWPGPHHCESDAYELLYAPGIRRDCRCNVCLQGKSRGDGVRKWHSPSDANAPDAMEWFAHPGCDHP
jgi:hypothetical protein